MFRNTIAVSSLLALGAQAAPRFGCPQDYKPMESFDIDRYAGKWYEVMRDKYTPFELGAGCVMAEYTPSTDGSGIITVQNSARRPIFGWTDIKGPAVQADTGDASLVVSFHGKDPDPSSKANYTVLDTDYETYSVVYSCGDILGTFGFDFLWILAREKELEKDIMDKIVANIKKKIPSYGYESNIFETYQGKRCDDSPFDQ